RFRNDPPKTRDRLSNARLPQARQCGVLLVLISSHSAQKVAACKGTKFAPRYFDTSVLPLPNNISESSPSRQNVKVNSRRPGEKVTAEVPHCVKDGLWQGQRMSRAPCAGICSLFPHLALPSYS